MQTSDIGSYQCSAYTDQHTSSGSGTLVLKQRHLFNVSVTPQTLDVEIGQTAVFTCAIYPPLPSTSSEWVVYKWSRVDKGRISNNARGLGTNTLTIVSNIKYCHLLLNVKPERSNMVTHIFMLRL